MAHQPIDGSVRVDGPGQARVLYWIGEKQRRTETLGARMTVSQGKIAPDLNWRTIRAFAAIGLLTGLSACASSTAIDTQTDANETPSQPVAVNSTLSPACGETRLPRARGPSNDAPPKKVAVIARRPAPIAPEKRPPRPEPPETQSVIRQSTPGATRTTAEIRQEAKGDRSTLPPSAAGHTKTSDAQRSVTKAMRIGEHSFAPSRPAPAPKVRTARSAARYRSRSAFPTPIGAKANRHGG